ncbi:MAG TPA: hypothetical protein VG294_07665 [Solirubrobacteraceae bacterium]|jgi:alpha-tubulin suppressor-like RCC1 family protein|nr:hypothetical protein [Solirubrobacteraceae bacterium]
MVSIVVLAASALAAPAGADQASEPTAPAAGRIATGVYHTCAILSGGEVECWGFGGYGALGYGNTQSIGVTQTPAAAGPVDLGPGRTALAISAGNYHTCALLDDGSARCWGLGGNGRLGYGSTQNVGDTQAPGSVGPVDFGSGQTALAVSAGGAHTCAVLHDGSVRCWGFGVDGQLGDNSQANVGDGVVPPAGSASPPDASVASVGPVDFGVTTPAVAVSAGDSHTCALFADGTVRCWGLGSGGQLGYGTLSNVGDGTPGASAPPDPTPAMVGAVALGQKAVAIASGGAHTCALLADGTVRCWGQNTNGQLGYGNTANTDAPSSQPVALGESAVAITAGKLDSCALLVDGSVRCWGYGSAGQLGYGNTNQIGDNETPASAGPVDLGPGRTALAISAGANHTCALLDNNNVICWGAGLTGDLGYCNDLDVGATQTPGSVGTVNLLAGDGGVLCPPAPITPAPPAPPAAPVAPGSPALGLAAQAARERALRACVAAAARARTPRRRRQARRACLRRYGRRPGRVTSLTARAVSATEVMLSFSAPGTDGTNPPGAKAYLVAESRRQIRTTAAFLHALALCDRACQFDVSSVGTTIMLLVTHLRPRTTYHYGVAAYDNVSHELGPRSASVSVKTDTRDKSR